MSVVVVVIGGYFALAQNITKPATGFKSSAIENTYNVLSHQYGVIIDDASGEITRVTLYGSTVDKPKKGETFFKFLDKLVPYSTDIGRIPADNVTISSTRLPADVLIGGVSYSSYSQLFIDVTFDALAKYYNENLIGSVAFEPFDEVGNVYLGADPLSSAFTALKSDLGDAGEQGLIPSVQLVPNAIDEAPFDDAIVADFNAGLSAEDAYTASENRKLIPGGCPQGQRAMNTSEGVSVYACADITPSTVQPPKQVIEYNFVCSMVSPSIANSEGIIAAIETIPGFRGSTVLMYDPEPLNVLTEKPCGFNVYNLQEQGPPPAEPPYEGPYNDDLSNYSGD